MDFDIEISNAWIQAAADLNIRVVARFSLTPIEGESILFEAHILGFGGPKGLIVGNQGSEFGGVRKASGYYYSNLYPGYRRYNRQLFIDTLNDCGWFGERGAEPSWYTGKPWS
jgi:hypothetical protein